VQSSGQVPQLAGKQQLVVAAQGFNPCSVSELEQGWGLKACSWAV
jgi:hypothetical protein